MEGTVFNWDLAAQLIRERKPAIARAGLLEDWGCTGGVIFNDEKPTPANKTYTFLSSKWATPVLMLDSEIVECWVYKTDAPEWNCDTYWPESALKILQSI